MTQPAIYEETKIDLSQALKFRYINKLSFAEIAKQFNTSKQAIQQRLSRFTSLLLDPDDLQAYKEHKDAILEATECKLIGKIVDEDTIKSASLNNAAYAFQQIFNARRLESGKSTANTAIHLTIEHQKIAEEVLSKIAESEINNVLSGEGK